MSATSVERLLGGAGVVRAKPTTPGEWIELVRRGLPAAAVDSIAKAVGLSQAELCRLLAISDRTLIRRKKEGRLSSDESAKVLRVARIVHRAIAVFENRAKALEWLKSPNRALGSASPLSLLDTDLGAEAVFDTLGRIEHGVFA
ncbi:MAG: antitoxin Xre-like helix-turn-helix domain-containing protein [Burkholderiales bacterium]